ncbi:MAG: sugar phosphate isomerase/epimerase [Chitinophagaceae bacterium]|nr:MAG: sugar phosphate isomerase/epimerase [Chitinophagaceae bacterium]
MERRDFVKTTGKAGMFFALAGTGLLNDQFMPTRTSSTKYPLSLAQWSLHKAFMVNKSLPGLDFARKAKELGFDAIEYVNQLYQVDGSNKTASIRNLAQELKKRSDDEGVRNVQIMVDNEGDLCATSKEKRQQAIDNHKRWIDASHYLGCVSTRVNLFGDSDKDPAAWQAMSVESLSVLADYAAPLKLNVVVENHGGLSSDASKLAAVMKAVGKQNCGTLPDFGNFCVRRENGAAWGAPCVEQYDIYKGTSELMPYAKGVSAKTFDFKANGDEATIDYERMGKIIRDSGFTGYLGVEYEGDKMGEEEGILATRRLVERIFNGV